MVTPTSATAGFTLIIHPTFRASTVSTCSAEHNMHSSGQSRGLGAVSYASVTSDGGGSSSGSSGFSFGSRVGPASHASGNPHSSSHSLSPTSAGHASDGPPGHFSSFASASQADIRIDPGRSVHLYPNGRIPSPSGNGVAYANYASADPLRANLSTGAERDFVKEFSSFFFQVLLPLVLKGEYSAVFDSSLKFILNFFKLVNSRSSL